MSEQDPLEISRLTNAVFSEGDLIAVTKIVELAIMISDKRDTPTITKNIDNVLHYMKTTIPKIGAVKQALK